MPSTKTLRGRGRKAPAGVTRKAPARKRLRASETAERLLAKVLDTAWDCAAWEHGKSSEPYAPILARAKRADRALLRYIARLEAYVEAHQP